MSMDLNYSRTTEFNASPETILKTEDGVTIESIENGPEGYVLVSHGNNGSPTFELNNAGTSSDVVGGNIGQVLYQQAPSDTTFTNAGPGVLSTTGTTPTFSTETNDTLKRIVTSTSDLDLEVQGSTKKIKLIGPSDAITDIQTKLKVDIANYTANSSPSFVMVTDATGNVNRDTVNGTGAVILRTSPSIINPTLTTATVTSTTGTKTNLQVTSTSATDTGITISNSLPDVLEIYKSSAGDHIINNSSTTRELIIQNNGTSVMSVNGPTNQIKFLTPIASTSPTSVLGLNGTNFLTSSSVTGTGSAVFNTSPTFITPTLGTASGTILNLSAGNNTALNVTATTNGNIVTINAPGTNAMLLFNATTNNNQSGAQFRTANNGSAYVFKNNVGDMVIDNVGGTNVHRYKVNSADALVLNSTTNVQFPGYTTPGFLSVNATGVISSQQAISGTTRPIYRKFTSGTSFSTNTGVKWIELIVIGGGGGGGAGSSNRGGGGGASGSIVKYFAAPGTYTYAIGTGGTAGTAGGNGGTGGNTTVSAPISITAGGGLGGTGSPGSDPGSGGIGDNGASTGPAGSSIVSGNAGDVGTVNHGGNGGFTAYFGGSGYATTGAGVAGINNGAGGSGGFNATDGGAGASGAILCVEYY